MKQCSVKGCDLKYRCSGFCKKHYAASRYDKDRPAKLARYCATREHNISLARQWNLAHPERVKATNTRFRLNNPEDRKKRNEIWRLENAEQHRRNALLWAKNNPARKAVIGAARRAAKTASTPAWASKEAMQDFYQRAQILTRQTGIKWHVDHIVPLKSRIVCGFHCEDNLQVIPYVDNLRKGNRVWPDMPT